MPHNTYHSVDVLLFGKSEIIIITITMSSVPFFSVRIRQGRGAGGQDTATPRQFSQGDKNTWKAASTILQDLARYRRLQVECKSKEEDDNVLMERYTCKKYSNITTTTCSNGGFLVWQPTTTNEQHQQQQQPDNISITTTRRCLYIPSSLYGLSLPHHGTCKCEEEQWKAEISNHQNSNIDGGANDDAITTFLTDIERVLAFLFPGKFCSFCEFMVDGSCWRGYQTLRDSEDGR